MLSAPIVDVADPNLFTSNSLFGQPGLYPNAAPMSPAVGQQPDEDQAFDAVTAAGDAAVEAWNARGLSDRVSGPLARASVAALAGTIAAPLAEAFLAGDTPVRSLTVGSLASPGRVVGPVAGDDSGVRAINERYQAEHPLSVAPSIAHDLGWSGPEANHAEETVLHMIVALVHAQFVARSPRLAHRGTELVRRQNSLLLPLLCSRHPGSAEVTLVAADGAGTAPGGDPKMRTADFWSIPFGPAGPGSPIPEAVGRTLAAACGDGLELGDEYDDELGNRLSSAGIARALPLHDHLRVAVALGLVNADMLAQASGLDVDAVGSEFEIADALDLFEQQ